MAEARVVRPDRRQLRWDMIDLEGLLPADHRARLVWSFVESLDLSPLYDRVLAREGEAGRPAADPAVLLSLWLYATLEGVGSARELERLAQNDAAYRWLAGGVPLNYHGLADFRVDSVEVLDRLLTQSVTALIAEGLISLAAIAVDGTKVRASASKESFRTGEKLLKIEAAVAERLAALKQELRATQGRRTAAAKPRKSGRRARFRSGRQERGRRSNGFRRSASRAPRSTSRTRPGRSSRGLRRPTPRRAPCAFPTARLPRLQRPDRRGPERGDHRLDRGDRPAQRCGPGGADGRRHRRRYGRTPDRLLVDTSYATSENIVALAAHAGGPVEVYTPPPTEKENVKPATLARRVRKRAKEPFCLKAWRERMASEAGKAVYALRQRIERINADRKNHGFGFLPVRGLIKAKAHALWHALANNLAAAHRLRIETP